MTVAAPAPTPTSTSVSCPASVTYDGAAKTPCTATVTGSGGFSQDLGVSYTSNTDAGTVTASAAYAGSSTRQVSSDTETFQIARASSTTVVTCPASVVYAGVAQTPCSASVSGAGGLTASLTPSYEDNTSAGTATASATYGGDDNHNGSSGSKSFAITTAGSAVSVTCAAGPFTYTGLAQTPCSATVTGAGGLNESVAVTYEDNTGAGKATASATYAGDANHAPGSDSETFVIGQADAECTVTDYSGTYDGAAHTVSGTCTGLGGVDLSAGFDPGERFTVAGEHTTTWTFAGGGNYADVTGTAAVSIAKAASTTVVTCPAGGATFDGSAQEPCTAKVTGVGGLDESVTVSYTDNTNAGAATASATYAGDGNHTGSSDTQDFVIAKATTSTVVICPDGPFVYTGSPLAPACTATTTGGGLATVHPTVSLTNNTNAGIATASASYAGDDDHLGSNGSTTFVIDKASSRVTLICTSPVTYTGSALEVCSAAATGDGIASPIELEVDYTANTDVGAAGASAAWAGDDNHTGSTGSDSFTIAKAESVTTVACPATETYTGSSLTPCTATVTGAGVLNEELQVTYTDNTDVGTATASAAYAGDANHNGSTGSETFEITKATTTTTVTCPGGPFDYTGSPLNPDCTATTTGAGLITLHPSITFSNNTDAGMATASASYVGDDNHTGSTGSDSFRIDKAASTVSLICDDSATYTGSALEVCSATANGAGIASPVELEVDYTDNLNVGTATASAAYAGDANHNGNTASDTFEITKAGSVTTVTCPARVTYAGAALTPCTATTTGAGLTTLHPSVAYGDNTNAGTATASATYTGDANHTGSSDNTTFTIAEASTSTTVTCPADPSVYTGSAITPGCTATTTGAGGLSVHPTVTFADNTNAGTATASASYAGGADHLPSSGSTTFVIAKAPTTTSVTCSAGPFTYTGSAYTPCSATVTGAGGLSQSATVVYTNNTRPGTATASATLCRQHQPPRQLGQRDLRDRRLEPQGLLPAGRHERRVEHGQERVNRALEVRGLRGHHGADGNECGELVRREQGQLHQRCRGCRGNVHDDRRHVVAVRLHGWPVHPELADPEAGRRLLQGHDDDAGRVQPVSTLQAK